MANLTDELAGTWVFNGNPSLASLYNTVKKYDLKFTSNGIEFSGLSVSWFFGNGGEGYEMYYKGDTSYQAYRDHWYSGGWKDAAFKTITITSLLAEVENGNTLLSWLKNSATKQVDETEPEPEPEPEEPEEPEIPTNPTMKLEVLYKGEVIGTLSLGQTAIVPKGKKFTGDIVVRAVDETSQNKLDAPTISFDNYYTLKVQDTNSKATNFNIYANDVYIAQINDSSNTIDLSTLFTENGTYNITATAMADGYEESEHSNVVEYVFTDISGTHWEIPNGWRCEAGYDYSDIIGTIQSKPMERLYIGYRVWMGGSIVQSNTVAGYIFNSAYFESEYRSSTYLTINITDGRRASKKTVEWLNTYNYAPESGPNGSN